MSCLPVARTHLVLALAACAGSIWAGPSQAQTTSGRAIEQAGDAFGVRVGAEQIGLYSESLVRGLNLQDSGNYRLGGAYFAKAANLVDPILSGVVTRVGYNALGTDFPAPTGVVEYGLRSPIDAPGAQVEAAVREFGTEFYELVTAHASADGSAGVLAGGQVNLGVNSAGLKSDSYRLGLIGEWRPRSGARLSAFYSLNKFDLEGLSAVIPTAEALPPTLPHPARYTPDWGDHDGWDLGTGAIASIETTALSRPLTLTGSVIYSRLDLDRSDYVSWRLDDRGLGTASIVSNRPRDIEATAVALGADWAPRPGHRLFSELRWRSAASLFAPAVTLHLDDVRMADGLPHTAEPLLAAAPQTTDRARQLTFGVGYEAQSSRLRLKGGVQRASHQRTFHAPGTAPTAARQSPWLYDLSIAASMTDWLTAFATLTRGLEDSGVAPSNAVNRNEVLPAVIANQQELGVRAGLGGNLTLIASAFRIGKPAAGFDGDGRYRLSGDVTHQGLELSLSGRPMADLRLLAGAAWLDARRAGELVEAGEISEDVPGVSRLQAVAGLTWDAPWTEGLSFDAQANYFGPRRVRSTSDLEAPGYGAVNLGLRQVFTVADLPLTLRLRVTNLFDSDAWIAGRSETLDRVPRRGVQLSLSWRG